MPTSGETIKQLREREKKTNAKIGPLKEKMMAVFREYLAAEDDLSWGEISDIPAIIQNELWLALSDLAFEFKRKVQPLKKFSGLSDALIQPGRLGSKEYKGSCLVVFQFLRKVRLVYQLQ